MEESRVIVGTVEADDGGTTLQLTIVGDVAGDDDSPSVMEPLRAVRVGLGGYGVASNVPALSIRKKSCKRA